MIQIVIAPDGCVAISGSEGERHETRGIVVRPDAEHFFDCNGAFGVMVFVDPESSEGTWLSTSLWQDITVVPDTRLEAIVPALRTFAEQPDESADIAPLVRQCIQGLRPGLAPTRRLDSRVTTVLDAIRASDDLSVSNSWSGGDWELDQVPAVGDPPHIIQIGGSCSVSRRKGQGRVTFQ